MEYLIMILRFACSPNPNNSIIPLKDGGFCINPLNVKLTQNMIKNMRECAKLKVEPSKRK
jgi:hypothetical protein